MKTKELRALDNKKLSERLEQVQQELLRYNATAGNDRLLLPTGPKGGTAFALIKNLKKERARILTIMNERSEKWPRAR